MKQEWAEVSESLQCGTRGLTTRTKQIVRGTQKQAQTRGLSQYNHLRFGVFSFIFLSSFFRCCWVGNVSYLASLLW